MNDPLHLLYAEDNPQDADLTRSHLEREAPDLRLEIVETGALCLERLAAQSFDLLLLDNHLPDLDGLDVLAKLRAEGHMLPVVMVTGVGDDETVARALRAGAADYVPKTGDYLATLPGILRGLVARQRSRRQIDGDGARSVRRILYVEPNPMDAELTANHFATAAPHLQLLTVPTCPEALTRLAPGHDFELVLTDLRVPGMNALEFIHEARHRGLELPFIVITGRGDEATAVAILRLGASDYLVKRENYLTQLPHAIDHALHSFQLDQTTRRLHAELAAINASLEQKVSARTAELNREMAERKQAEAKLRQSQQRLRDLIDGLGPAMFVGLMTPDGKLIEANRPALAAADLKPEDVLGQPFEDTYWWAYSPEVQQQLRDAITRAARGEPSRYDVKVRAAEGQFIIIDFALEPLRDKTGKVVFLVPSANVITERVQAGAALRESEARLRLSVAASNIGLWDWNLVTNDVYFSPEWKGHLGCADDEIPNRFEEWESRLHPDDLAPTVAKVRAFIEDPEAHYAVEFRMRHKDGSWRWIFTQAQVFRNAAGKPLRMMGCHIDITERKRTEAEVRILSLQLSRTEEEQRRQIARELHDSTGQKLAALSMTVGLLQDATSARDGKTEKMFADCLAMIDQCAQEIRTHSYLLHPPLLDELGLSVAISNYVEGFSKRSGVRVVFDPPPDFERFPDQVEIALFRVVQESMGNIHRHAGAASARIRLASDAEHVTLEVSDQGRGISAEMLHALETGRGATGVGIAGMRERLRLLGGRLEIESGKHGTTVRAIVPPRPEPA